MSIKNRNIKKALVLGAGGFIGSHLVRRLKKEGFWVRGVDLKQPEFNLTLADHFILGDLRNIEIMDEALNTEFLDLLSKKLQTS